MIGIHQLAKRFRHTEALCGLDLHVPEGAIFALVGPSGAGKTTLLKTILNIHQPTSGRSEVLGVDSRKLGPKQFEQIGYVSENQHLPEWMTVDSFLSHCRGFYPSWNDRDAANLVRDFDLPLDRALRVLSRGMRMKAALAASLAYGPKLLILDEPFSGLDPLVRDQIIESILNRASETTVLVASHDLAELESFASHVAFLNRGRLLFAEDAASPVERDTGWRRSWLKPEQSGTVVRFVESQFEETITAAEIYRRYPNARSVAIRPLSLRSTFTAVAGALETTEA